MQGKPGSVTISRLPQHAAALAVSAFLAIGVLGGLPVQATVQQAASPEFSGMAVGRPLFGAGRLRNALAFLVQTNPAGGAAATGKAVQCVVSHAVSG